MRIAAGAGAALEGMALQLAGGPAAEKAESDRNPYAWVLETGKAALFVSCRTNAVRARAVLPPLRIVRIPATCRRP